MYLSVISFLFISYLKFVEGINLYLSWWFIAKKALTSDGNVLNIFFLQKKGLIAGPGCHGLNSFFQFLPNIQERLNVAMFNKNFFF